MVNILKLKLTILQQEILRLLFIRNGVSMNARGVANALGVSQPAVMKSLPEMKREGLINLEQDEESRRWAVSLNQDNHKIIQQKRADNLKQIYDSELADFLEKEFAGATIILFGSFSRGDDTFDSDIDIAVIGRKNKELNLTQFEKILERKININFYPSFKEINKYLRENLFSGILLAGGIEI